MLDQAAHYLCEDVPGGGKAENEDLVLEKFGFPRLKRPFESYVLVKVGMYANVVIC